MSNILLTASSPRLWPSQSRRPPPPLPLPPMSNILETGLDRHTLSLLIALFDQGLNPEALTSLVRELSPPPSKEPISSSSRVGLYQPYFLPCLPSMEPHPLRLPLLPLCPRRERFLRGWDPPPKCHQQGPRRAGHDPRHCLPPWLHGRGRLHSFDGSHPPVAICPDACPADADFAAVRAFPNSALLRRILDRRLVLPRQGLQDAPRLGLRLRLHHRRRQLHLLLEPQRRQLQQQALPLRLPLLTDLLVVKSIGAVTSSGSTSVWSIGRGSRRWISLPSPSVLP